MFNHRLRPGHDRTFEAFTKIAFPSAPERPFSSKLLDGLALLSVKRDAENFTAMFTQILLSIWSQSVEEKYVIAPLLSEQDYVVDLQLMGFSIRH